MIRLPNGKVLSKIIVSTAFGLDGEGIFPYTLCPSYKKLLRTARKTGTSIFTKSITLYKRQGNFVLTNPFTWKYIKRLPNCGMLNAYGLTNPGTKAVIDKFQKSKVGFDCLVIPSFYPEFSKGTGVAIKEIMESIELMDESVGFCVVELNFSCPNSKEVIRKNMDDAMGCVKEVRKKFPWLSIIAKISIVHPYEFSQELERVGVDMLHSINTVPFGMVYPDKISPMANVGGGGVSGKPIFWQAYDYNKGLREKVKIPIIMGGGVVHSDHIIKYLGIGADAVSICTVALRQPEVANEILELFNV